MLLKWSFFPVKDQTYTANEVGTHLEILILFSHTLKEMGDKQPIYTCEASIFRIKVCVCIYIYNDKPIHSQKPTKPTHFDPTHGGGIYLQMLEILLSFSVATQKLN